MAGREGRELTFVQYGLCSDTFGRCFTSYFNLPQVSNELQIFISKKERERTLSNMLKVWYRIWTGNQTYLTPKTKILLSYQ
jgi:hypothetical protein